MFSNSENENISSKKYLFIRPMIILLLAILIATPIVFVAKVNIGASSNVVVTSSESSSDEDYTFILIEEEDIPLAAAPSSVASNVTAAVVGLIFASITFGYLYWYLVIRKNIFELTVALSPAERKEIYKNVNIIHPRKVLYAQREAEAYVAKKYFNNTLM